MWFRNTTPKTSRLAAANTLEEHPEIYAHEVSTAGPAGTVLA